MEQGAPAFETAVPAFSQRLKAKIAEREVCLIAYQTKAAPFLSYEDLSSFDFAASKINEAAVRQRHLGDFMDRANNVVFISGPGTGKTHVATVPLRRGWRRLLRSNHQHDRGLLVTAAIVAAFAPWHFAG